MRTFFLVKVKLEKTAENGKVVKVSEVYLIDALSFTEAEQRIIKELEPFISGEFEVSSIARKKYKTLYFLSLKSQFMIVEQNENETVSLIYRLREENKKFKHNWEFHCIYRVELEDWQIVVVLKHLSESSKSYIPIGKFVREYL